MPDVQQSAGVAPTPGFIATIADDPVTRNVWLILMGSVAYLVAVGVVFRAR